ncbi:MAG: hypothetical protein Q8L53_16650 [Aestuariivirga sp.]|nr:hypothetical protein [Aestuariivirga sp.]
MTGFKTLLWNAALVVAGALVPWLAQVDWTQYVSPTVAVIIVAVVNVVLRIFTTTPVLNKN